MLFLRMEVLAAVAILESDQDCIGGRLFGDYKRNKET